MFSTKPVELGGGIKLRTSLAYNPDLERLTLAVFQCQVRYLFIDIVHHALTF